ncbi:MAG: RidA family protein [Deltaproteobacteria bacterium]|nr:RidA family protein [Deltaproteobacteria bacterium]
MKKAVSTDRAPKAIGPYSQGIVCSGSMIFCSGQIPLNPDTQELVAGDIQQEAERALDNLGAVLAAAGATFENVVRTTIFLTDLSHFASVNEVYGRRFTHAPPARVTVGVASLPKGARVEIDAIAIL